MTKSRFRAMLVLVTLLVAASVWAGLRPGGYSQDLADAFAREPASWLDEAGPLPLTILIALVTAWLAGLVGLFFLRSWARPLAAWSTLLALPRYMLMGPVLMSPFEAVLAEAAAMAWGFVLALAYFSPISAQMRAGNSLGSGVSAQGQS